MTDLQQTTSARRLVDAFLAGDAEAAAELLADDATFHSPVRDYAGVPAIAPLWGAVTGVIDGAHATTVHETGRETAAFFAGAIQGEPVDGVLRAVDDGRGQVRDVTLMLRPWATVKKGIGQLPAR